MTDRSVEVTVAEYDGVVAALKSLEYHHRWAVDNDGTLGPERLEFAIDLLKKIVTDTSYQVCMCGKWRLDMLTKCWERMKEEDADV